MAYKIINYGSHNINQLDIKSVTETLNSAWLSQGPKVKNFEITFLNVANKVCAFAHFKMKPVLKKRVQKNVDIALLR